MRDKDGNQDERRKERREKEKEIQRLQTQVGLGSAIAKLSSLGRVRFAKQSSIERVGFKKPSSVSVSGCFSRILHFAVVSCFAVQFAISSAWFGKTSAWCVGKAASMLRRARYDGSWTVVGVLVFLVAWAGGSEFPERECCDPVYPPNTATTAAVPVTPPITKIAGKFVMLICC